MAIAGQRVAQQARYAGTQSARAMGRATNARAGGPGMSDELIVQLDTGWVRIYCDPETGCEKQEPYDMKIERRV